MEVEDIFDVSGASSLRHVPIIIPCFEYKKL